MKKIHLILILLILFQQALAQMQQMHPKEYNLTDFDSNPPRLSEELDTLSSAKARGHPEYGILPWNADCDSCSELLDKRTLSSRYFIKNGTGGNTFFVQQCNGNLHYVDQSGDLISYDHHLAPLDSGIYVATHQETPTEISTSKRYAGFLVDDTLYKFNKLLELVHVHDDGTPITIGSADWSTFTIGSEGMYVFNIWPGIDMEMKIDLYTIKTSFIIKSSLGFSDGYLVIVDHQELPPGYSTTYDDGILESGGWKGTLRTASAQGQYYFETGKALVYDESGVRGNGIAGLYECDSLEHIVRLKVPFDWLNNPLREYPVVIDPQVTSSATWSSGIIEYHYGGTFCAGSGDCQTTLNVVLPASTLTGCTFSNQYVTVFGSCGLSCWMSDAGFQIDGICATSPSSTLWWSCPAPLGNSIGTCTASNYNLFPVVSCVIPACSYSLNFKLRTSYCFCANGGDICTGTNPCTTTPNNTYSVTVTGSNLELLGNTGTGNGSQNVNETCCTPLTLNPSAANGVPPYTYLWNNGATTSTLSVTNCTPGVFTYTCTVTDACATVRTATFNVTTDCILPIELTSFRGVYNGESIDLFWTTESEKDNDYFVVERSANGLDFDSLMRVEGAGTSTVIHNYQATDNAPLSGLNYYRLRQVDFGGVARYSSTISVEIVATPNVRVGNPVNDNLYLYFDNLPAGLSRAHVEIMDCLGRSMKNITTDLDSSHARMEINVARFGKGVYIARIEISGHIFHLQFLKQ